jgi:excisionase family DNA binding protein
MDQAPISKRERLLTAKEVADWLGVSEKWIYDHIERREPKIPAKRLGGAVRFKASEIDLWLDGLSGSNETGGKANR